LHSRIKDGVEGGERAAHALQTGIRKQLKESYPDINTDNWQIMVWCIAAMDGLVNVYEMNLSQKDGFSDVNFTSAFRRFAIGFNRGAHYTFNFIDVGGGRGLKLKEITDAKLRDTFRMSKYLSHFIPCITASLVSGLWGSAYVE
jgi:hypothetical protein